MRRNAGGYVAGRRKQHLKRLSRPETEAVCRVFLELFEEKNWSANGVVEYLTKYSRTKEAMVLIKADEDLHEDDFGPNPSTITRILEDKRSAGDGTAKALKHWLSVDHSARIEAHKSQFQEVFASSFRSVLGFEPFSSKPEKIRSFAGEYRMYRPFHLDPKNKVIVERLTIGSKESPFESGLSCRYETGKSVEGVDSTGRAVPHGQKLLVALRVGEIPESTIIIYFDRLKYGSKIGAQRGSQVSVMYGTMIASVGTADPASSWPCYAERIDADEAFEPYTMGYDEEKLPVDAVKMLSRGAIYWDPDHFPNPFARPIAL